jgi:hypothetical protein
LTSIVPPSIISVDQRAGEKSRKGIDMDSTDAALPHYRGMLARLENADPLVRTNRIRAAMGHPPLSHRAVEHDRSLAAYDRALGEGRN